MQRYSVRPLTKPLRGSIRPPGSKSITNRACICAALADGTTTLTGALDSEDTQVMFSALRTLGLSIQAEGDCWQIQGGAGAMPVREAQLNCANSGTSIRFLTAALAVVGGNYRLDGIERMRERPIADLTAALRALGASAVPAANGCPPVELSGPGASGGETSVAGDISSQFLSGLLMAAPAARQPVTIRVDGQLVSAPYVQMTIEVMKSFGARVSVDDQFRQFRISPQTYRACRYAIEPDASAASYFWAAAAITGGEVTVEGLGFDALQGDVDFCRVLQQMGCVVEQHLEGAAPALTVRGGPLHGVDVDMNHISDTVQTLAAVALHAQGPTRVRGVAHNRHKETDRIADLARELRRFGADVAEHEDGLTITPPTERAGAEVETYNDHRMAMSLALVGLTTPGVTILNPACTGKTYPAFWDDLERLTAPAW